jgi:hypothetical protein
MKSVEHSLCSFECALLLKYWLEMVSTITSTDTGGLRPFERKILDIITAIIQETDFSETLDGLDDDASRFQFMAGAVLKLWARIFHGTHVLEIDNAIGAGLQLVVDTSRY